MSLSTHYPYSAPGLKNLLRAARQPNPEAFGIVFKVKGNEVVNWMYADPVALKTIATQNLPVAFQNLDDKRSAQVLRDLAINLNEGTPFVALMIRYKGQSPAAWAFVDLGFIKTLTDL